MGLFSWGKYTKIIVSAEKKFSDIYNFELLDEYKYIDSVMPLAFTVMFEEIRLNKMLPKDMKKIISGIRKSSPFKQFLIPGGQFLVDWNAYTKIYDGYNQYRIRGERPIVAMMFAMNEVGGEDISEDDKIEIREEYNRNPIYKRVQMKLSDLNMYKMAEEEYKVFNSLKDEYNKYSKVDCMRYIACSPIYHLFNEVNIHDCYTNKPLAQKLKEAMKSEYNLLKQKSSHRVNYIGIEICLSFINLCLYIPKPNEYTEEVYSFLDNIKIDGKYYRMINETDKQNFSKTSNKSLFDTISEIYQEGKKINDPNYNVEQDVQNIMALWDLQKITTP